MSSVVVIETVIPFNSVLDMFGADSALIKYGAFLENMDDRLVEMANVRNMSSVVTKAIEVRAAIIKHNANQILPIPVLRVCVMLQGERSPTEQSLQSTSHMHIPIFVSASVVDEHGLSNGNGYSVKECVLGGVSGYYIQVTSPVKQSILKYKDRSTNLSVNYVCCARGNYVDAFRNLNGVIVCEIVDGLTYACGNSQDIYKKCASISSDDHIACAIHACTDFTHSPGSFEGNGVKCVKLLVEMTYSRGMFVTEAASYYISDFDKRKYHALDVRQVGSVYMRI
jgi:hypothetical protein